MKWMFWKKVMEHEPPKRHSNNCVFCGKHVLRQSTLDEFGDTLTPNQTRLPITIEKVGMDSEPRRYRGSI